MFPTLNHGKDYHKREKTLNTKPMNDQPSEDILREDLNDHSEWLTINR